MITTSCGNQGATSSADASTSSASAIPPRSSAIAAIESLVVRYHPLGHAHPPRIQHELAHLRHVDRVEPHLDPVVPQVPAFGHQELRRVGGHERFAFLLGEPEAHDALVT